MDNFWRNQEKKAMAELELFVSVASKEQRKNLEKIIREGHELYNLKSQLSKYKHKNSGNDIVCGFYEMCCKVIARKIDLRYDKLRMLRNKADELNMGNLGIVHPNLINEKMY